MVVGLGHGRCMVDRAWVWLLGGKGYGWVRDRGWVGVVEVG